MAKSKRSGASYKGYYTNYKASRRWEKNRRLKLERALRENPNNAEQINKALGNIEYRRQTPAVKQWSATRRRIAELFKLFTGVVPKEAFLPMPNGKDEISKYLENLNKSTVSKIKDKVDLKSMFSLGARARVTG